MRDERDLEDYHFAVDDGVKYSGQMQKHNADNALIVHCVQNVILYTDKGRLDTVIGIVGGLVGLADIVL